MPRQARIDAPGALHHLIVRGIARMKIFDDDEDRRNFLDRFGDILQSTQTSCYAWSLLSNHLHLLLRTGNVQIATVMRRLLTGYAVTYNHRHRRWGHLFQNRYKSILCQEEPYFLELVRYIHLNPLRAGIVKDLHQLDGYAFGGHSVLMGNGSNDWQDTEAVLSRFGSKVGEARGRYREFVAAGISLGKRADLVGGGLIRSAGGWSAVKELRKAKAYAKGDERILGDGEFVDQALCQAEEVFNRRHHLRSKGVDLERLSNLASSLFDLKKGEVWSSGKNRSRVQARSLLCYWAVRELGESMSSMSRKLNLSITAVSKSVERGEALAKNNGYKIV
ncbi:MAG: transposase [Candidatus Aminicenantes bacterium]|nr:transposase [Candidatus Aminicenantes bacterium]